MNRNRLARSSRVRCSLARTPRPLPFGLHLSALRVGPPVGISSGSAALPPLRDLLRDAYGRWDRGDSPLLPMSSGDVLIATTAMIPLPGRRKRVLSVALRTALDRAQDPPDGEHVAAGADHQGAVDPALRLRELGARLRPQPGPAGGPLDSEDQRVAGEPVLAEKREDRWLDRSGARRTRGGSSRSCRSRRLAPGARLRAGLRSGGRRRCPWFLAGSSAGRPRSHARWRAPQPRARRRRGAPRSGCRIPAAPPQPCRAPARKSAGTCSSGFGESSRTTPRCRPPMRCVVT